MMDTATHRSNMVEQEKMNTAASRAGAFFRRLALAGVALLVATVIWLPLVHLLFTPADGEYRRAEGIPSAAEQLARRHLDLWDPQNAKREEVDEMRANNPEWDYMGRTFLVLSLANMVLRDPMQADEYLAVIDRIIEQTRQEIDTHGHLHFLMEYGRRGGFLQSPTRSLFVDGELALMMSARRLAREHPDLQQPTRELVSMLAERMAASPVLCCESYPNECWLFCNTVALAAIRISDVLDGSDHSGFFRDWLATARRHLLDPTSGMLVSSFTYEGQVMDGPEGSSIWLVAHCLDLIDSEFAREQYDLARRQLGRTLGGFAWAREWPPTWKGPMDIDSGAVIPYLDISAGSSGLAFVGAAAFEDDAYYRALVATIRFAGFPQESDGRLRFCASNQVGDAVLLYSTVLGPLWAEVHKRDVRAMTEVTP